MIETLRANTPSEAGLSSYSSLFQKTCALVDRERLPALIDVFESVSDRYRKTEMFVPLAEAWIRINLPEKLAAPVAAVEPAEPVFKAGEDTKSFLTHENQYWQLIGRLLRSEDAADTVQQVDRYVWGFWCGTGADRFEIPQAYARIIGDIQEQRWSDLAAEVFNQADNLDPELSARLLTTVLADPFANVSKWIEFTLQPERNGYYWEERLDGLLAISISLHTERRLDFLESVLPKMQVKASAFKAIGKFVPVGPRDSSSWRYRGSSSRRGLDQLASVVATADDQKRALELLDRQAFTDLNVKDADELAEILAQKYQPDSIPALRQLLQHPSGTVAAEAAEGLRAMGEEVQMPAKLGDVRCEITMNGKPLSLTSVDYTVVTRSSQIGSSAATSEGGVLSVPRDWFLNPGDPVTRLVLRNSSSSALSTPRFVIDLPPPASGEDRAIPVNFDAKALVLKMLLPRPMSEYRDREMTVTIKAREVAGLSLYVPRDVITIPVSDRVEFPSMAAGDYEVEVRVPGAAVWRGTITAGKENTEKELPLERATDVNFTISMPEPWQSGQILPELWKGGVRFSADFDYEKRIFRGIPPGAYTLKISSSAQQRKMMLTVPEDPEFGDTERGFEIKADAPMEIDLGKITVSALSAKPERGGPNR